MKAPFTILLFTVCLFIGLGTHAQNKVTLNYYSQETLDALGTTKAQQKELTAIKTSTDTKIREARNNAALSEEQKKAAYAEAYKTGGQQYGNLLNAQQKAKLSALHQKITKQNAGLGIVQPVNTGYKNPYYDGRMNLFENLPAVQKGIVFLGNSITERGMWSELFPGKIIQNRGIGGDNTFGILARLDQIIKSKPEKVFLLIGVNDIARGIPVDTILSNYQKIVKGIISGSPATKIYIQSVLPMNDDLLKTERYKLKADTIKKYNSALFQLAKTYKSTYVNIHDIFLDTKGVLNKDYTDDGIHINPKAYALWADYLKKQKHL